MVASWGICKFMSYNLCLLVYVVSQEYNHWVADLVYFSNAFNLYSCYCWFSFFFVTWQSISYQWSYSPDQEFLPCTKVVILLKTIITLQVSEGRNCSKLRVVFFIEIVFYLQFNDEAHYSSIETHTVTLSQEPKKNTGGFGRPSFPLNTHNYNIEFSNVQATRRGFSVEDFISKSSYTQKKRKN